MMLYSWWHLMVSRHRCPSLLTSSRWPWSPLDSHFSLDSWHDCSAAWGPQAHLLHFFLDERTEKPRKCLDALLRCSGALGSLVGMYHTYAALTCSPGPTFTFSALVLGKQVGGKQWEAYWLLRFHSGNKAQVFFAQTPTLLGQFKILGCVWQTS